MPSSGLNIVSGAGLGMALAWLSLVQLTALQLSDLLNSLLELCPKFYYKVSLSNLYLDLQCFLEYVSLNLLQQ